MPRKIPFKVKQLKYKSFCSDRRYDSEMLESLANYIMKDGKKSVAYKILYTAIDLVIDAKFGSKDPEDKRSKVLETFDLLLDQIKTVVEVKSKRIGGANYQVPVEIPYKRQLALAFKWLITSAQARSEKSMAQKLAKEILEALEGRGSTVKKKMNMIASAKANQAFANIKRKVA